MAISKLGEGSYGKVLLAKHRLSGAKFAIKISTKSKMSEALQQNQNGISEIDIMRECTKTQVRNIIELVDSYEDTENHYIVTKFMPGGDLLNYLQK